MEDNNFKCLLRIILLAVFFLYVTSCAHNRCIQGNCQNGQGIYKWDNGDKYKGEFKDNTYHGWGTYTCPDGQKYEGEFKNGMYNGWGTVIWPNHNNYKGEFKDNKKVGWGTFTWANGEKYEGYWEDDKRHSWGALTLPDGSVKGGRWENDTFVKTFEEIFIKYEKNEEEFKKYFKENLSLLDPIEGIWSVNYRTLDSQSMLKEELNNQAIVAIIRDETNLEKDYVEVVLSSEQGFIPQTVTAHFKNTAYNGMYISRQLAPDGTYEMFNFSIDDNGFLRGKIKEEDFYNEIYYVKLFPPHTTAKESAVHSGSGFLLTESGLVVTNHHVIEDTTSCEVVFPYKDIVKSATIKMRDISNDIAILAIKDFNVSDITSSKIPFNLAKNNSIKTGEEVFTLGFPLAEDLGKFTRLSTGVVNSPFGIDDDPSRFQISNPVHPGNSGGPLFNLKGELVGIVVARLNEQYVYEKHGIIPQNVNFAIKINYLNNLIGMLAEEREIKNRTNLLLGLSLKKQVEKLAPYVVTIKAK